MAGFLAWATANSMTITTLGMGAQVGAGYFTGRTSGKQKYEEAKRMCDENYILWLQRRNLETALVDADKTIDAMKGMRDTQAALQQHLDADLKPQIARMQANFINNFTLFLFFLTVVTGLLFFAIDKQAGRSSALFDKVNKVASLNK